MSIKFAARLLALFMLVTSIAVVAGAQQTSAASTPQPSSQSSASQSTDNNAAKPQSESPPPAATKSDQDKTAQDKTGKDKTQDKSSQEKTAGSNDRLFFALPNYLTLENGGNVPPLTAKQKFGVVAKGAFDYIQIPWYGLLSALSQAEDSEPAYGQGWEGYGKRFATAAADGTIENFMVGAVLPSILHQDPRFFQSSRGGFARRAGYAVSRIVITRTDSGHSQFNYSEIFGSAMSASISTFSYHPRSTILSTPTGPRYIPSDRTLSNTASVWGSQLGYDTITIVIKEFWPDIHRKLSKKHSGDTDRAVGAKP